AAGYPGAVRTVTQTLPPASRTRGFALAYSGGSLGALLTPLIITPVAAAWGWRGAFWFSGLGGPVWRALLAPGSRGRELARPLPHLKSTGTLRWNDAALWGCFVAWALGSSPMAFVLYQASIYLSVVWHKSQLQIGHVLWIPPLAWEIGFFFWGWVTD